MDRFATQVVEVRSGEVLAQKVDFAAWPSPFIPSIGQGVAKGCIRGGTREQIEASMEMFRTVFTE
jgi:hypothetical protein